MKRAQAGKALRSKSPSWVGHVPSFVGTQELVLYLTSRAVIDWLVRCSKLVILDTNYHQLI